MNEGYREDSRSVHHICAAVNAKLFSGFVFFRALWYNNFVEPRLWRRVGALSIDKRIYQ
jgi:hypothetical protein